MQQAYQLGKLFGKLTFKLQESVEKNLSDTGEIYKAKYQFIMETLVEILLNLEETMISELTEQDVTEEIERLVEIYGELKFDKDLPKGQKIIGGLKQKFTLLRQSRKTLKNQDTQILYDKAKIWDDRINIALGTSK